jgi:hypothetical protein
MTCRRLKADVMDAARGIALDPARESAVTTHLRSCSACTALAERQRAMSLSLRRLVGEPVPPLDPVRLNRILAAIDAAPRHSPRSMIAIGLSVAASVALVVSLSLAWKRDAPPTARPAAVPPVAARAADAFVVLPAARALPRFEHGQVIRVEIPSPGGVVQADVLVGQDGLARAVRFVE